MPEEKKGAGPEVAPEEQKEVQFEDIPGEFEDQPEATRTNEEAEPEEPNSQPPSEGEGQPPFLTAKENYKPEPLPPALTPVMRGEVRERVMAEQRGPQVPVVPPTPQPEDPNIKPRDPDSSAYLMFDGQVKVFLYQKSRGPIFHIAIGCNSMVCEDLFELNSWIQDKVVEAHRWACEQMAWASKVYKEELEAWEKKQRDK